jgi:hypothetical protein
MSFAVVRNPVAVSPKVAAELSDRLEELALLEPGDFDLQVDFEAIDGLRGPLDLAMP